MNIWWSVFHSLPIEKLLSMDGRPSPEFRFSAAEGAIRFLISRIPNLTTAYFLRLEAWRRFRVAT
jgi:hypothetical protein